jgi:hypothetical protein
MQGKKKKRDDSNLGEGGPGWFCWGAGGCDFFLPQEAAFQKDRLAWALLMVQYSYYSIYSIDGQEVNLPEQLLLALFSDVEMKGCRAGHEW